MHPPLPSAPAEAAASWRWCVRCQRCYTRPAGSDPDLLSSCVYLGCDGAAIVCEYPWERIRRHDPAFPEVPRFGVRYRVYA